MKRLALIGRLLFDFRGRLSRSMLWVATCVWFVYCGVVVMLSAWLVDGAKTPRVASLFILLFVLSCGWSHLAISMKRFHDRSSPGWWAILNVAPVWVFIYVSGLSRSAETVARLIPSVVLLFCIPYIVQIFVLRGDKGVNRYGPVPPSVKAWWLCE